MNLYKMGIGYDWSLGHELKEEEVGSAEIIEVLSSVKK